MSPRQTLRAFVTARLAAAAEDIFELFERTILEYEEELCRCKEKRRQETDGVQVASLNSDLGLMSPGLNTETPQIKEELEEQSIKQKEEEQHEPAPDYQVVNLKNKEPSLLQKQTEYREETQGEERQMHSPTERHTDNNDDWRAPLLYPHSAENPGDASGPGRGDEANTHQSAIYTENLQRPHYCPVCDKAFVYSATFRNHMQMHTGVDNTEDEKHHPGQTLRALVTARLAAAAEDIFELFERTILEYEEELCRCKEKRRQEEAHGVQVALLSPGPSLTQVTTETPLILKQEDVQLSVPFPECRVVEVKMEESSLVRQEETQFHSERPPSHMDGGDWREMETQAEGDLHFQVDSTSSTASGTATGERLYEFLRERNKEGVVQRLKKENLDKNVVPSMTNQDLEQYIPKVEDGEAAVSFCRKRAMLPLFAPRAKVGYKRLRDKAHPFSRRLHGMGNTNAKRQIKRIELGWMSFDEDEERYKQVRTKNGGGTLPLSIDVGNTMEDIKALAESLFFPDGVSKRNQRLADYSTHIESSQVHVDMTDTVAQAYDKLKGKILRLLKPETPQLKEESEELQEEQEQELVPEYLVEIKEENMTSLLLGHTEEPFGETSGDTTGFKRYSCYIYISRLSLQLSLNQTDPPPSITPPPHSLSRRSLLSRPHHSSPPRALDLSPAEHRTPTPPPAPPSTQHSSRDALTTAVAAETAHPCREGLVFPGSERPSTLRIFHLL
uniref:C2H2-type domain-containing protein n=1 Tax=Knipowitschia caucasica TaxID=637954 RepID=A0AAV2M5A2_KNICA